MSSRSGFALVLAIIAIVCLGVLLAGMAFVAREDHVLSAAGRDSQRAFTTAERALWTAAASLDSSALNLALGDEESVAIDAPPADTALARVSRLSASLFLITGEAGARTNGGAYLWRRVGLFVRVVTDSLAAVLFEPLPDRAWFEIP